MALSVLFVDDEPKVLRGLRRKLDILVDNWTMSFAESGTEALSVLRQRTVDVVVADMRMPGMDGIALLAKIADQFPYTIRFILSGYASASDALRAANFAHQFLAKPMEVEQVVDTINQAITLRNRLNSFQLRQLVSQIRTLPSVPLLYTQLMQLLQSPNVKPNDVGEVVAQDLGMTTKILQLVNSAYFGLPNHVPNPTQAVILLGLNTIKTLALTLHVFSQMPKVTVQGFSPQILQRHSLMTASLAKKIARGLMLNDYLVDCAFTAGMLHAVGRLILTTNMPQRYQQVLARANSMNLLLEEVEKNILGVSHADVSAYLLELWGLPLPVVEAVLYHYSPCERRMAGEVYFSPLIAVHIADVLAFEVYPKGGAGVPPKLDPICLTNTIIQSRLPQWRDAARKLVIFDEDDD